MSYKKITVGFVIQNYDDNGKCIDQEFIAGDNVSYENEDGEPIDVQTLPNDEYMPFEMVQPETVRGILLGE